jgi:hypothetical protein
MIRAMDNDRSHATITRADLKRLAHIAQSDREDFFERHREWALLYRRRLLAVALCADAAMHYLNGITGVQEFAVWTFYAEHAEAAFPFQRVSHADLGKSKFGRGTDLPDTYEGRRVVLQSRSLDATPDEDPLEALQRYLKEAATPTSRELARKAVVLLEPEELLGLEAWPSLVLPPRR